MDLRIFTEPQQGATYDDLLAVAQTAERLGYGNHQPVTVPDAWLELLDECGPELSEQLALGVPDLEQQRASCE